MPKATSPSCYLPLKLALTRGAYRAVLATAAVTMKAKARVVKEIVEVWAKGVEPAALRRYDELVEENGRDALRNNMHARPRPAMRKLKPRAAPAVSRAR